MRDRIIDRAERIHRRLKKFDESLSPMQRAGMVIFGIMNVVIIILFLVYNERVFAWLEPYAVRWKDLRGGWLILWAMMFVTAFPPVIGYSTCLTIAGFVFGFTEG